MKTERTLIGIALIMVAITLGISFTFADPVGSETVTTTSSSSRTAPVIGESADARGGNVSQINIEALSVTQSWQGYYGQVSGEITLDDANNNTFYNWTITTVSGEVYASRQSSLSWTLVNCMNDSNITDEESYLGQTASDSDSVSNTFNLNAHPGFSTGARAIAANNCSSTYGYVNNATQTANWSMVLLFDYVNNETIYASIMNDSTVGFDGGTYDFQMLVGENEKSGSEGVTSYYFWVELD